jgi:hypothetical protein
VLRPADPADFALVEARFTPADAPVLPPGRALATGAVEVQVARPEPADASRSADRWDPVERTRRAFPVARLPRHVPGSALPRQPGHLVLGVGGPEVEPLALPIGEALVLLVAGPMQSGRSSTVARLASELLDAAASRTLIVAPRGGPLTTLSEIGGVVVHVGTAGTDVALDEFVAGGVDGSTARRLLVIDDAEQIGSAPGVAHRLEQLLREAPQTRTSVLVAARTSDLPGMFDPWARYLVSLRRALLLQPTVDDAFLFGAKLPTIPPPLVPGRGVLIDRMQVTVLQVAGTEAEG